MLQKIDERLKTLLPEEEGLEGRGRRRLDSGADQGPVGLDARGRWSRPGRAADR